MGTDFESIGHIGVIARILDHRGIVLTVGHCDMDGLAVRQDHGHPVRCLARDQPMCGSDGCCRGACACGQAAVQWVELRQQLLDSSAQSMRAIDMPHGHTLHLGISGPLDHKDGHARPLCRCYLLVKASTATAFLGQYGLGAQLFEQLLGVVVLVIDQVVGGKARLSGLINRVCPLEDSKPALTRHPIGF